MNNCILLKKEKLDSYYKNDNSSQFLEKFNQIFNKIPHIYGEIFLKLFENRFKYFVMFERSFVPVSFTRILERLFCNINVVYDEDFFYQYIKDDLLICLNDIVDYIIIEDIAKYISFMLASNIECDVLLDIIDNKINNSNYYDLDMMGDFSEQDKLCLYEIIDSYLISKVLVKVVKILNLYNSKKGTKFYELVSDGVDKFRTWDMVLSNVLDIYDYKYRDIVSEDEFKILIYLISLSRNGEDIDNSIGYNIDKLFDSMSYDTSMRKIIDCERGYNYLEVNDSRFYNDISNLFGYRNMPVIYESVSDCLEILFDKYYDDYNFIVNKDKILRKIFYLYMRNVNLYNKLVVCTNYKMWGYEWDSIKDNYELNYLEDSIISSDDDRKLVNLYKIKYSEVVSGEEFEIFLEELFNNYNLDVKRCGKSGDQGGDLLVNCNGNKYVVQAKFYSSSLGNEPVQEVLASLNYYGADRGVVVTNSRFTKGAIELAYVNNIILIDGERLRKIISNLIVRNNFKNRNIFDF